MHDVPGRGRSAVEDLVKGSTLTASPRRRLVVGSAWTASSWIVGTLASGGVTVVLVRTMSHSQYGKLALATSAVTLLSALTGFGLVSSAAQVTAAGIDANGSRRAGTALKAIDQLVRLVVLVGVVAAVTVAVLLVALSSAFRSAAVPLLILVPVSVMTPVADAYSGFLRAVFRPGRVAASSVVSSLVTVVLISVVVTAIRPTAGEVAAIRVVAMVCAVIVVVTAVRPTKFVRQASDDLRQLGSRLRRLSAAMVLTAVFASTVSQLDVFVLGLAKGNLKVASYQPLSRTEDLILSLPGLVGAFFLPIAARVIGDGREKVGELYHWASRWSFALCAPPVAVTLVHPRPLLHLLFGSSLHFTDATARALAVGGLVQIALGFNGLTLDAFGDAGAVLRRQVAALGVNVIACAVLIPTLGALGAALATSSGLIASNVLCSISLYRRYGIPPWDAGMLATITAFTASVLGAAFVTRSVRGDVAPCVIVGGITMAVTLIAAVIGGSPEDIDPTTRRLFVFGRWRRPKKPS